MISKLINDYGFIRVACSSPELKVSDVWFNLSKIKDNIVSLCNEKAQVILFPELSITGHSCGDLFYQRLLIEETEKAILDLLNFSKSFQSIIIVGAPIEFQNRLFNCALVLANGKLLGIVPKTYLCNSGVYYERRWFTPALIQNNQMKYANQEVIFGSKILFNISNFKTTFGIEICEDLWAVNPPSSNLALAGAEIIFNLSGSAEYLGHSQYRKELVKTQSARLISAYLYASSGANESTTDFVYSGHCLIAENGKILKESERLLLDDITLISDIDVDLIKNQRLKNSTFGNIYNEGLHNYVISSTSLLESDAIDLKRKINKNAFVSSSKVQLDEDCSEVFTLQTLGLAKRLKHTNCEKVVLGVSGGLDSTLALLVAINTFEILSLDITNIFAVNMPGFGSTGRTKSNALNLSEILGVTTKEISINQAVLQHFEDIDHNPEDYSIVYENSQARERTQILMDIANQVGGIVIGTGDLSELALGWCTFNADQVSMYNLNSGVPKTLIKPLLDWYSESTDDLEIRSILKDVCNTPISPELLPLDNGQNLQITEEKIGPYILHDFFLYYILRHSFTPKKVFYLSVITFKGVYSELEILKWLKVFIIRFFNNQFKRNLMPDGVKIGSVALSPRGDWRMPSDASKDLWLKEVEDISIY
ncbi:MAG: NAD(+) synthase [Candidatus Kapabacteria bacterium]|nr:NAD(+) synthase [Candidatus Kapabacteria bacterium]